MAKTQPWSPHQPVWEWCGLSQAIRNRALEQFEERSAILEFDGQMARQVAELRTYCRLIEIMHARGIFSSAHMQHGDVVRQLSRAEGWRRHDAIGRRIMAGTWPKRASNGVRTNYLTEADLAAD